MRVASSSLRSTSCGRGARPCSEGKGGYPFGESADDIIAWMNKCKRDIFPKKVVIEPNLDTFRAGYWVNLGRTDPLAPIPVEQRPRAVVEVDRETNRITLTTTGVSDVGLLLNDDIVDLDKPVVIEVNGKVIEEKLSRDPEKLFKKLISKVDPKYLVTQTYSFVVPKKEEGSAPNRDESKVVLVGNGAGTSKSGQ